MIALRCSARVAGTVLLEAAAFVALVAVGRRPELAVPVDHLGGWLHDGDPATVVVALLRWAALLGTGWLVASTLLYLAASLCRAPAAVRAIGWSTLPAVRRAVDAACAVTVVGSVVLAPSAASAASGGPSSPRATDPPSVSVVRDGRGIAQLPADTTATTRPPTTTTVPVPVPVPVPPLAPAMVAPAVAPVTVSVAPGDNLWILAARELARVTGREPEAVPDAEIAPYWVLVCEANRDRLPSGDPNLVHPGEQVVLPPSA